VMRSGNPQFPSDEKRMLEAIRSLASILTAPLDLSKALEAALVELGLSIRAQAAALLTVDQTQKTLQFEATWGLSQRYIDAFGAESVNISASGGILGRGPSARSMRERTTVCLADVQADPSFAPWQELARKEGYRAVAFTPLLFKESTIGALGIYFAEPRSLSEGQVRFLEATAALMTTAMESAYLLRREQERRREAAILLGITQAASSSLELDEVLERVAKRAASLTGADRCGLWLLNEEKDKLIPAALFGMDETSTAYWKTQPVILDNEPLSREAISSGLPVVVADARTDPRTDKKAVEFFGDKSILVVPLLSKGEAIGTLFLNYIHKHHDFTVEDIGITMSITVQAAAAIANARLYDSEQARRHLADTLRQVSEVVSSTLDLNEVLELILDQLRRVVDYDSASIQLLVGDRLEIIAGRGFADVKKVIGISFPLDGNNPNRHVIADKKPLNIPDAPAVYEAFREEPHFHIRSWLGVPLLFRDKTIGMIALDKTTVSYYTEEDARLAMTFANQAAVALENARLYEEIRQRAAQLALVSKVARRAVSILDLDQLLQGVVVAIQQSFNYYHVGLFLLDEVAGELQMQAVAGGFASVAPPDHRLALGEGMVGWAAKTGQSLLANDVSQESRYVLGILKETLTKAELCVPLKLAGKVIGVLDIQSSQLNTFDETDLMAMETLADQIAVAIENARLYEHARESLSRAIESEGRYREMIEDARDMIIHLDLEGRLALVNKKAEELSGYSRQEALGRPFTDFICPEYVEDARRRLALTMTNRTPDEIYEIEFFNRAGKRVPVELTANPIEKDELQGGQVLTGLQIIARDVRERKRLETERAQLLAESQRMSERLRDSFHQVGTALASSLDLDEVLHLIVELAASLLDAEVCAIRLLDEQTRELPLRVARGISDKLAHRGVPKVGQGWIGLVAAQGVPLHVPDLQGDPRTAYPDLVAEEGLHAYLGVPLLLHDKVVGVLSLFRKHPSPFTSLEVELLSSFAHQASVAIERAELFATVLREKKESEAIIRNTADGIAIIDHQQRIVDLNPALERLIGWPREKALGASCSEVLHGCNAGKDSLCEKGCPFSLPVSQDDSLLVEHPITTHDGRQLDVQVSYGLIRDEAGEVSRVIAAVRDISKQKELERMRSEFVSTVSHEFRTPLALIKGYIATLLRQDLALGDETRKRFLRNTDEAADRLSRLIRELLSVSRIEAGRLELNLQPLDLKELVAEVLERLRLEASHCQLVAQLPSRGLVVQADSDKVERVLLNLLTNAIKFSPEGGTVTVKVQWTEAPPGVLISVTDQGSGIPPEHLDRVFDKFYQAGDDLVKKTNGVGLGLYICKSIVEYHGGRIWVESTPGEGSTFQFTLPQDGPARGN
jgi:PAS domain S-box-containing protein